MSDIIPFGRTQPLRVYLLHSRIISDYTHTSVVVGTLSGYTQTHRLKLNNKSPSSASVLFPYALPTKRKRQSTSTSWVVTACIPVQYIVVFLSFFNAYSRLRVIYVTRRRLPHVERQATSAASGVSNSKIDKCSYTHTHTHARTLYVH